MRIGSKNYAGNATDNRSITHDIVGGTAAVKWVLIGRTNSGVIAMHRNDAFSGDESGGYNGTFAANRIQAFEASGIQVGTATQVNAGTGTYNLVTMLADAAQIATGSYIGTGIGFSVTGIAFQPDIILVKGDRAGGGAFKTNLMAAGDSVDMAGNPTMTTGITAITSDGFTLGTSVTVNEALTNYRWTAWKKKTGKINTFSYVGDAVDNRNIAHGLGGTPVFIMVVPIQTSAPCWREANIAGDNTYRFDGSGPSGNMIQTMDATNIQIGTDASVNTSGRTYHGFGVIDDVGGGGAAGRMSLMGVGG